jgi:hypothetical protein
VSLSGQSQVCLFRVTVHRDGQRTAPQTLAIDGQFANLPFILCSKNDFAALLSHLQGQSLTGLAGGVGDHKNQIFDLSHWVLC